MQKTLLRVAAGNQRLLRPKLLLRRCPDDADSRRLQAGHDPQELFVEQERIW